MEAPGKYGSSTNEEARQLVSEILSLCRTIARKPRSIVYLQKLKTEAESYANYKSNRGNDPRLQPRKLE